jgi:hypothetical protein
MNHRAAMEMDLIYLIYQVLFEGQMSHSCFF